LRESLRHTTEELNKTKQRSSQHESEKLTLRQQLVDLQDQLDLAKRSGPINGELVIGATNHNTATGLINLVSSKKPKRRSAGAEPLHTDRFSGAYNPRPVSMAVTSGLHKPNLSGSTFSPAFDNVGMELEEILSDEDGLNDEVAMGLIRNLKIPSPNSTPPPS